MLKCPLLLPFLVAAATLSSQAQILLVNTGSSTVSSAQAANAPFTTGLSTSSSWNNTSTDVGSGLLWADGSAATGISVDLGASGNGFTSGSTFSFATNPSTSAGTAFSTLAATGTAQKDFIFAGTSGQNTAVGLRINGLAAGVYNIYVGGWNSAGGTLGRAQQFWAGTASSSTTTFTIGDLTLANGFGNESVSNANMGAWSEGTNFSSMQVTVDLGESLVLLANGTNAAELRGFLNFVQLETVSVVPEPSPGFLFLSSLSGLVLLLRRKRNSASLWGGAGSSGGVE